MSTAVLRVNKLVGSEALDVLYGSVTFEVNICDSFIEFAGQHLSLSSANVDFCRSRDWFFKNVKTLKVHVEKRRQPDLNREDSEWWDNAQAPYRTKNNILCFVGCFGERRLKKVQVTSNSTFTDLQEVRWLLSPFEEIRVLEPVAVKLSHSQHIQALEPEIIVPSRSDHIADSKFKESMAVVANPLHHRFPKALRISLVAAAVYRVSEVLLGHSATLSDMMLEAYIALDRNEEKRYFEREKEIMQELQKTVLETNHVKHTWLTSSWLEEMATSWMSITEHTWTWMSDQLRDGWLTSQGTSHARRRLRLQAMCEPATGKPTEQPSSSITGESDYASNSVC